MWFRKSAIVAATAVALGAQGVHAQGIGGFDLGTDSTAPTELSYVRDKRSNSQHGYSSPGCNDGHSDKGRRGWFREYHQLQAPCHMR